MSKKFLFTTRLFVGFLSVLAVLFTVLPCAGQALAAPDVRTQFSFAQDEHGSAIACLSIRIPAGYHAYAHDPGDVGRPASLSLLLDGATLPCPVYYPAGALQRDYYDKEATVHVYEGEQLFFVPLHREDAGSRYSATLSLLLCSSLNCTPLDVTLRGTIPENLPDLATKPWKDQWLAISAEAAPVQGSAPEASLGLSMADGPATPVQALPGDNAADLDTPPLAESATALVEEDPLPAPAGFNFHISPVFADTSVEIYGLGKALLLGILAGLLLNVMPCVLPVLTFKVTGLLMANAHGKESLTRFREHNLCFAAGILGGPPVTTYAEVTGAMSITKVTHPQVIRIAAVAGIVFSLVGKVSALLKSIPGPVLGGIMLLLFGTIATAGVANIQQHKVDLSNTRNIVIFSLTLTVGIGGATFTWGEFSLSGIGLAAIVGVILNLILPKSKD